MKVAVCLSGELRGVKFTLSRLVTKFREYFGDDAQIDYFVYSSDRKLKVTYWMNRIYDESHVTHIDDEDIKVVNDICNPKIFKIECDYKLLKKKIVDGGIYTSDMDVDDSEKAHCNSNFREFGQFHFAEQVIQLMCEYETKNNMIYDVVVRTRTDIVIGELKDHKGGKFELQMLNRGWGDGICVSASGFKDGRILCCDLYFIGSRNVMVAYHSNIIEKLCVVYTERNKLSDNHIFYNFLLDLRQGERKWAILSILNPTTLYNYNNDKYDPFPISLLRDHYEKNTWKSINNLDDRMEKHGYFVMYFNEILSTYIQNKRFDLEKIKNYFKDKNIFDVLNSKEEIVPFFEKNSSLFVINH